MSPLEKFIKFLESNNIRFEKNEDISLMKIVETEYLNTKTLITVDNSQWFFDANENLLGSEFIENLLDSEFIERFQ